MSKTCPKCGYENNAAHAFKCGLCGAPFVVDSRIHGDEEAKLVNRLEAAAAFEAATGERVPVSLDPAGPVIRHDFAAEQRKNSLESTLLLITFPIILAGLGWGLGIYIGNGPVGIAVAAAVALIYMLICYFTADKMILTFSNAKPANPSKDADHNELVNLVEEMTIAAGLPLPKCYVIETEACNAFATGRDPGHASITVTRGLMKLLNREEMQGVVAHEMGHIRNLDIRYMMLVAALVGAVTLLADAFRRQMYWGGGGTFRRVGRAGSKKGGNAIILILALILAILAPFFAMLVQMAISRKREFLADASAVEFTRNPSGLASALEKISNMRLEYPLPGANRATQHLYIVNPFREFGQTSRALMSTHPPLEARIRLLRAM